MGHEEYYSDEEIGHKPKEEVVYRGQEVYRVSFPINTGSDDTTYYSVICGGLRGKDWNESKKQMLVAELHKKQMEVEFTGPNGFTATVKVTSKKRAVLSPKQALEKETSLKIYIGDVLEELKITRKRSTNNLLY